MKLDSNGNQIDDIDRTGYRYFIDNGDGERETDINGYIDFERSCGFHPKPGCGPLATGGFTSGNRSGRYEAPFPGPARILDGDTGESEPVANSTIAFDRAREMNDNLGAERRRRYFVLPA